jgi:hypothetical protein
MYSGLKVSASEEIVSDYDSIVNYISNHLTDFKKEYNKNHIKEPLRATNVEHHCLVYILDVNEYGVYLDFNDDRGYLVTSFNLDLFELNTSEDLEYLKDLNFTYYSTFDGFLYDDGNSYKKYIDNLDSADEIIYSYNGQDEDGESKITNLQEYMSDRYPSYKLEEKQESAVYEQMYIPTNMYRTSYYLKYISNDGGYIYDSYKTESNCALTAAFNVMSSWKKSGIYLNLPSKAATRDVRNLIKDDPDYKYYGVGEDMVGHDFYWSVNDDNVLMNFPELYYQLRLYAVTNKGYDPELGLTTSKAKDTMEHVIKEHEYSQSLKMTTSLSNVIESLQQGRAVFMGISNSTSYVEDHAVALLGYQKYSYKTGVWIFEKTHIAYFLLIDDGQINSVIYFDPNCNSNLSYEFIYK